MSILADCPSCYRKVHVPDHLVGQLVQCPTCGQRFTAEEGDGVLESEEAFLDEQGHEHADRDRATVGYGNHAEELPNGDDYHDTKEDDSDKNERRRPLAEKPPQVQTIGIMMLVGGIFALLVSGGGAIGTLFVCCMWPGTYYGIVLGILAVVKGAQLLGENAHLQSRPKGIAIMQIINIINGDVVNCVMGVLALNYLKEPEVQNYFRR
jgi:hypothetical protein